MDELERSRRASSLDYHLSPVASPTGVPDRDLMHGTPQNNNNESTLLFSPDATMTDTVGRRRSSIAASSVHTENAGVGGGMLPSHGASRDQDARQAATAIKVYSSFNDSTLASRREWDHASGRGNTPNDRSRADIASWEFLRDGHGPGGSDCHVGPVGCEESNFEKLQAAMMLQNHEVGRLPSDTCCSDKDPRWSPGSEQEIVRGEGREVTAASLNKSIDILTIAYDNAAEDDELMMALVLLHRVVSTPRVFLRKLISRFHATQVETFVNGHEADEEGELVVMRHKVCSIILVWLRDFYKDFCDQALVLMLKSFLGMKPDWSEENTQVRSMLAAVKGQDLDWSSLMLVKDVMCRVLDDRLAIINLQQTYIEEREGIFRTASSESTTRRGTQVDAYRGVVSRAEASAFSMRHGIGAPSKSWHILQLDKSDVARQLTNMESRLFFGISYAELLQVGAILKQEFAESQQHDKFEDSPDFIKLVPVGSALRRALESSVRLSAWVSSTIVVEPDHARRAQLVSFFIAIADECHQVLCRLHRSALCDVNQ